MNSPAYSGDSRQSLTDNSDITILFTEDDEQVHGLVGALLQDRGYNVIDAIDGQEALRRAREFTGPIHLLLSDNEMPNMTGIELAIQLNKERPETKILLVSGLDSGMLVLNNGWQFLPKPFVANMLKDRIRDFLAEQPPLKEHVSPGS